MMNFSWRTITSILQAQHPYLKLIIMLRITSSMANFNAITRTSRQSQISISKSPIILLMSKAILSLKLTSPKLAKSVGVASTQPRNVVHKNISLIFTNNPWDINKTPKDQDMKHTSIFNLTSTRRLVVHIKFHKNQLTTWQLIHKRISEAWRTWLLNLLQTTCLETWTSFYNSYITMFAYMAQYLDTLRTCNKCQ